MNPVLERKAFEAANRHRPLMRDDYKKPDPETHDRYYDIETQAAWEGWQTARAAMASNDAVDAARWRASLGMVCAMWNDQEVADWFTVYTPPGYRHPDIGRDDDPSDAYVAYVDGIIRERKV